MMMAASPGRRRSIGATWLSHELAGDVDADQVGFPGVGRDTQSCDPLVNLYKKTMDLIYHLTGKTNYFDWAMALIAMSVITRG